MLNRLHDHDRIVDDQADGEDETEQRQRVDGETEQRKRRERPDERHRHRQHRNQGCTPALEKQEYDQHHQGYRLGEGLHDLPDAFRDRKARVQSIGVVNIVRERLFPSRHELLDRIGHLHGVGAGSLKDGDD